MKFRQLFWLCIDFPYLCSTLRVSTDYPQATFYGLWRQTCLQPDAAWTSPQCVTADAEIMTLLLRTQSYQRFSFKACSKNIALRLLPTSPTNFYFPGTFNFIFRNLLPSFFLSVGAASAGSCVCPQSKIVHDTGPNSMVVTDDWCRYPCWGRLQHVAFL